MKTCSVKIHCYTWCKMRLKNQGALINITILPLLFELLECKAEYTIQSTLSNDIQFSPYCELLTSIDKDRWYGNFLESTRIGFKHGKQMISRHQSKANYSPTKKLSTLRNIREANFGTFATLFSSQKVSKHSGICSFALAQSNEHSCVWWLGNFKTSHSHFRAHWLAGANSLPVYYLHSSSLSWSRRNPWPFPLLGKKRQNWVNMTVELSNCK